MRKYEQVYSDGVWIRSTEMTTKEGKSFVSTQVIIDEEYTDVKVGKDKAKMFLELPRPGESKYYALKGGLTTNETSGRKEIWLNSLTELPRPEQAAREI